MQLARLVQSGEGDRRFVVLLYLIHPDRDPALREALGPKPMILARTDDGDPGPRFEEEIAPFVPNFAIEGLVLGGWSAGCQGVRRHLLSIAATQKLGSLDPLRMLPPLRALVLADGTHASLPPQPWQLDVWRPWIEKARIGEELDEERFQRTGVSVPSFIFAASHTYQTYVEHLPGGKAYTSTVNVLRALTGWSLDVSQTANRALVPLTASDHDLHVESWASATCDKPAHERQQTEALPGMLARYVRPMIEASI